MNTQELTHYKLNQAALRQINRSSGDFRPRAACGHGSAHAKLVSYKTGVTCPECKKYFNDKRNIT